MAERSRFSSYQEFFAHYLRQHSNPANRLLHACGTVAGLLVIIAALALRHPWFALLWIPVGYGLSWSGHMLEHNRPATWGNPFWSFISDFYMLALMLTGRLDARLSPRAPSGDKAA